MSMGLHHEFYLHYEYHFTGNYNSFLLNHYAHLVLSTKCVQGCMRLREAFNLRKRIPTIHSTYMHYSEHV